MSNNAIKIAIHKLLSFCFPGTLFTCLQLLAQKGTGFLQLLVSQSGFVYVLVSVGHFKLYQNTIFSIFQYKLTTKTFQVLQTSKWSVFHNFIIHWKGTQVIINPELLPANLMSSIPYSVSEPTQVESYLHGLQHKLKHICRHLQKDFNILL